MLLLLLACERHVVVRAGGAQLTAQELATRLKDGDCADLAGFARKQIEDAAMMAAAKKAGLPSAVALRAKVEADVTAKWQPKDLTDDELRRTFRERVQLNGVVFGQRKDAEQFAAAARKLPGEHAAPFRMLYEKTARAHAQAIDFSLEREQSFDWPTALLAPAFAGAEGSVIGPITAESGRYVGPRHYVFRVAQRLLFAEQKERLRGELYPKRVAQEVGTRLQALVSEQVVVEAPGLAVLARKCIQ